MFQFHKVRLKELFSGYQYRRLFRFQFHKVRLKEQEYDISNTARQLFQFHKVRLKVFAKQLAYDYDMVSIP